MSPKLHRDEKRRTERKKRRRRNRSSSSDNPQSPPSSDDERNRRRRRKQKRGRDFTDSDTTSSSSERGHSVERRKRRERDSEKREKHHRKRRSHSSKRERRGRPHAEAKEPDDTFSSEDVASVILQKFPELKDDLEQLLKMLDDGQAVDISGLEDKNISSYLRRLFQALHLHRTSEGLFLLPESDSHKIMDVLGPLFHHESDAISMKPTMQDKESVHDETVLNNRDSPIVEEITGPQRRRVLGPAIPSSEMLQAAARLTEASTILREAEEELEHIPMVGPPPPAAIAEAESANEAERFEEVERILAPDVGNAYELLGVRVGTASDLLKKRYWKISLLVHPDKCKHPRAHEAFTVLNQSFKDLQDPKKRSVIDKEIEEKETREELEAELKAKREAAQWRKLRGEALPGDDELLNPPKPPTRDEWMTQLPPERKPGVVPMQSTFFSKYGKSGRGDTSVWTDTPLEKAQKAKTAYLEAYEQASSLTSGRDDGGIARTGRYDTEAAEIIDQFNTVKRGTSLLEKHQTERSKKTKKVSRKEASPPPVWSDSHPWKPWDREKDLVAGRKSINLDAQNMAKGLSSRFASSYQERSFL